jgi:hypothetical protein
MTNVQLARMRSDCCSSRSGITARARANTPSGLSTVLDGFRLSSPGCGDVRTTGKFFLYGRLVRELR